MNGGDEGEGPKVIQFVISRSEDAESFMFNSCSSIFKSAAYVARHKKVRHSDEQFGIRFNMR